MMNTYRIQMMSHNSFSAYLMGSNNYCVEIVNVTANSFLEAVAEVEAKYPSMVVNKQYNKTVAEYEAEEAEAEAKWNAKKAKEAEAKQRKIEREQIKAEAEGLTLEEYKAKKNRLAKIRKAEREVLEMEKELARKKAYLEKLKMEA